MLEQAPHELKQVGRPLAVRRRLEHSEPHAPTARLEQLNDGARQAGEHFKRRARVARERTRVAHVGEERELGYGALAHLPRHQLAVGVGEVD